MKTHELHRWDVTYREAVAIQEELRGRLILRDDGLPDPSGPSPGPISPTTGEATSSLRRSS